MNRRAVLASVAMLTGAGAAKPQETSKVHHALFEITVDGAEHWEGLLNNVDNLQRAFGRDSVKIEVVAHGKGIGILRITNASMSERMTRIAATGVRFAACENTMRRMKLQRSDLLGFVTTVDSGVAEVVRKQEAGWAYLKAGG